MRGTTYDGSHFANKGTSRSKGESMFSVGNLVAFRYYWFCSPDGRSSSRGMCPKTDEYLLQEEILLEEYENTTSNRYGSGDYDVRKIVELPDVFWHEHITTLDYETFALQILENNENVFKNSFISGDIAEVRNHPGKFLHIYEIPKGYRDCKAETFTATVAAINLQKEQEDADAAKAVAQNYRGVPLDFGITSRGGWYKPSANFGTFEISPMHEHDNSSTSLYKMVIMPCVPDGMLQFYVGGMPVSLFLKDGEEPSMSACVSSSWANSQKWWYDELDASAIQKGWIFVDGEDVFERTIGSIKYHRDKKIAKRNEKFQELSEAVTEKYGEEVLKMAIGKKGQVLATLSALADCQVEVDLVDVKKILNLGIDPAVAANLLVLVAAKVDTFQAAKVAENAYAWAYLSNALPAEVIFTGRFDDAARALEVYSKNWGYEKEGPKVELNTLGDFFKKNGIRF